MMVKTCVLLVGICGMGVFSMTEKEVNIGYHKCDFCGMDTPHRISSIVPDGMTCLLCGASYILDDVSGIWFEYKEEKQ